MAAEGIGTYQMVTGRALMLMMAIKVLGDRSWGFRRADPFQLNPLNYVDLGGRNVDPKRLLWPPAQEV